LSQEFDNAESAPILTGQGNTAQAVRERIDLLEKIMADGAGL
jgi:hypothetical protein